MRTILPASTSLLAIAALLGGCEMMEPRYGESSGYPYARSSGTRYDAVYEDGYYDASARRCNQCGTVDRIDIVQVRERASGGGAAIGAVIGGVVGHQIGDGRGQDAATVAGAIAGGVIGHSIEGRRLGEREVYQFHVRLDDGRWATVTQRDNPGLRQGSRVLLHDDRLSAIR